MFESFLFLLCMMSRKMGCVVILKVISFFMSGRGCVGWFFVDCLLP